MESEKYTANNDKKNEVKATDPHIPQFDFKGYLQIAQEFDRSPRVLDDVWQKYKKLSNDVEGSS